MCERKSARTQMHLSPRHRSPPRDVCKKQQERELDVAATLPRQEGVVDEICRRAGRESYLPGSFSRPSNRPSASATYWARVTFPGGGNGAADRGRDVYLWEETGEAVYIRSSDNMLVFQLQGTDQAGMECVLEYPKHGGEHIVTWDLLPPGETGWKDGPLNGEGDEAHLGGRIRMWIDQEEASCRRTGGASAALSGRLLPVS